MPVTIRSEGVERDTVLRAAWLAAAAVAFARLMQLCFTAFIFGSFYSFVNGVISEGRADKYLIYSIPIYFASVVALENGVRLIAPYRDDD